VSVASGGVLECESTLQTRLPRADGVVVSTSLRMRDSSTSGLIQQNATNSEIVQAFVHKHQTRNGHKDGSASPDNIAMCAAALQVNKANLLCDFYKLKDHDKKHCFAKCNACTAACQKAAKRCLTHCNNTKGGQQHVQEAAAIPGTA
jgi:hypothetical protein